MFSVMMHVCFSSKRMSGLEAKGIVEQNCRVTVNEMASFLEMTHSSAHHIFCNFLLLCKLKFLMEKHIRYFTYKLLRKKLSWPLGMNKDNFCGSENSRVGHMQISSIKNNRLDNRNDTRSPRVLN